MEKLKQTLASRKFWASVVGLLVVGGFWQATDVQQSELVNAITVVMGALIPVFYAISVAVEDGLRGKTRESGEEE